jgi:hypothetical protein
MRRDRLPRLMRTFTSCTLIRRAVVSPYSCFTKGSKITAEVGLSGGFIEMSRGGGYEYDEDCPLTLRYMTLYMNSWLMWFVIFHWKVVRRLRRHCNLARGYFLCHMSNTSRYVQCAHLIWHATQRVGLTTWDRHATSLVCSNRFESHDGWHDDRARACARQLG